MADVSFNFNSPADQFDFGTPLVFHTTNISETATNFTYRAGSTTSTVSIFGTDFSYIESMPAGGTAINVAIDLAGDDFFNPEIRIFNGSFNLTELGDVTSGTLIEERENDLAWRAFLGNSDTINMDGAAQVTGFAFSIAGDGRNVFLSDNVIGANDTFTGSLNNTTDAFGDYYDIETGGRAPSTTAGYDGLSLPAQSPCRRHICR